MFGIVTDNFVIESAMIFKDLHISNEFYDSFDLNIFYKDFIYTLNHTKDFGDARLIMKHFRFSLKNIVKICKAYQKKSALWKHAQSNYKSTIQLLSEDEARGTFYLTNAIGKANNKEFAVCSNCFDDGIFFFEKDGSRYYINDNSYYLKTSKSSVHKMKLYNSKGEKVAVIHNKKKFMYMKDNLTSICSILSDGSYYLYKTDYIMSLDGDNTKLDKEKCLGIFDWDILDIKSKFESLAMLINYELDDDELEIALLVCLANFIIFQREIKDLNNQTLAWAMVGKN